MGGIRRYWGFALLAVVIFAVVNNTLGPAPLILLSSLVTFYFLFQVPNWCSVINRNGTLCRENSHGLLMGCHRRQHKWQKIKLAFIGHYWRKLGKEIKAEPLEGVKTATVILGLLGGLVTLAVALVKTSIGA